MRARLVGFGLAWMLGWCVALADPLASAGVAPPSPAVAPPRVGAKFSFGDSTFLEDPLDALPPRDAATGASRDRHEALSLYMQGRLMEHRQDFAGALRKYERALRLDPQAASVANDIVRLAFRLKRYSEAIRYALKYDVTDPRSSDSLLMLRLGTQLAESGQSNLALTLYEKVFAARAGLPESLADVYLWLEMGRLYSLVGKHGQAADHFARVIFALEHPRRFGIDEDVPHKLIKEQGVDYVFFAESFLLAGRFADARTSLEKAQAVKPDEGSRLYLLARIDARAGKPDDALAQLQKYFDRHLATEGIGPYTLLAEILKSQGREGQLVERLEKLLAAGPDDLPLGYALADQYRRRGRFDRAESLYTALMKKAPSLAGYEGLVETYRKTGRYDRLLAVLGEVAGKTLGLESLDEQTKALRDDVRMMNALIETARRLVRDKRQPLSFGSLLAVALLTLEDNRYEVAGEFFELAVAANAKFAGEIYLAWGVALAAFEQPAQAIKVFQRALARKPEDKIAAPLYYYLAGVLAAEGRTEEALAAALEAARRQKDVPRMAGRRAWVLYFAKRRKEAAQAYAQLIEQFDDDHGSDDARQTVREAKLILSNLCTQRNQIPQAEEWLEQVLDEFPNDASALNDLGYLWAERSVNLHRAVEMVEQAVKEEPDNAAYRDSLGWVYYQSGRYPEAVAELEKAAAGETPDPLIFDHLGDACRRAHQPAKARENWLRAAELFRKERETDKAKQTEKKIQGL